MSLDFTRQLGLFRYRNFYYTGMIQDIQRGYPREADVKTINKNKEEEIMGRVEKSIEVNAPVHECYRVWTDFENFPRFMKNVKSIRRKGDRNVWHWEVSGPAGKSVEWDAEVDSMQPNKVVSWHSVRDSEVDTSGAVTFQEMEMNRTRINVTMVYNPPAGAIGEFVADLFKNPEKMVEEDLENFKQLVEQRGGVEMMGEGTME